MAYGKMYQPSKKIPNKSCERLGRPYWWNELNSGFHLDSFLKGYLISVNRIFPVISEENKCKDRQND